MQACQKKGLRKLTNLEDTMTSSVSNQGISSTVDHFPSGQSSEYITTLAQSLIGKGWDATSSGVVRTSTERSFDGISIKEGDYKAVKSEARRLLGQTEKIDGVQISTFFKNFASVKASISNISQHIQERGEKVSVVLGLTGRGKSTFINYMLGCTYKIEKKGMFGPSGVEKRNSCPAAEQAPVCKGARSGTFLPNIYSDAKQQSFIDTPGFEDTRGMEVSMPSDIGFCEIFKNGESTQAIIVLINHEDFKDPRCLDLRQLSENLKALSERAEVLEKSLLFVFTHVPKNMNEQNIKDGIKTVLANLVETDGEKSMDMAEGMDKKTKTERVLAFVRKRLSRQKENSSDTDPIFENLHVHPTNEALCGILSTMANDALENVFIANYHDGALREALNGKIEGIQLSKEETSSIAFRLTEDKKRRLSSFVEKCGQEFDKVNFALTLSQNGISSAYDMIEVFEKRLVDANELLEKVQNERFDKKEERNLGIIEREIRDQQALIKQYTGEIEAVKTEKNKAQDNLWTFTEVGEEIGKYQKRLSEINTDDLVENTDWSNKCRDNRFPIVGRLFGSTSHKFEYSGIVFEDIKWNCPDGHKFEILSNSPQTGKLTAKYSSPRGKDGVCDVNVFCKNSSLHLGEIENLEKSVIPQLIKLIGPKKDLISSFEKDIEKANVEIVKLKNEEESFDPSAKSSKELELEFENDKKLRLAELQEDIREFQMSLADNKGKLKEYKAQLKGAKLPKEGRFSALFENETKLNELSQYVL